MMYNNLNTPDINKKLFKRNINILAAVLIIYMLMLGAVFFVYAIGIMFAGVIKSIGSTNTATELIDSYLSNLEGDGFIYLIWISIGMVIIFLYRKKDRFIKDLSTVRNRMNPKSFFMLLSCFMGTQLVFSILASLVEWLFNQVGYSILGQIETATSTSTTISMFLYASFLGPITEEIIFRGAVLRKLEPYGKVFAIVVSAIVFGSFHGNLIQGVFAFMTGLVLGYVAIEYSIKWSIVMHILNNFIFGDAMGFITNHMNETIGNTIYYSIIGMFFIAACIILIKKRPNIIEYIKKNNASKKIYVYAFTSIGMILFLLGNLIMAIISIEKIAG